MKRLMLALLISGCTRTSGENVCRVYTLYVDSLTARVDSVAMREFSCFELEPQTQPKTEREV